MEEKIELVDDRSTKRVKSEHDSNNSSEEVNNNNGVKEDKMDVTPIQTTSDKQETTDTTTATATTNTTETDTTTEERPSDCVATESKRINMIIFGLPKHMDNTKFKKFLTKNGTECVKAKKIYRETFAIITLENSDLKQAFIDKYNGMEFEGNKLEAKEKQSHADRNKENSNNNNNNADNKKRDRNGNNTTGNVLKSIEDITNPWHKIEYKEQLEKKKQNVLKVLREMTTSIRKECKNLVQPQWLKEKKGNVVACPLEEVLASPNTSNYRNKTSYTIGRLEDGSACVGFALGRTGDGITVVGDPSSCLIISERSNAIRKHLQEYIRSHKRPPFDKVTHTGFWRQMNVRDFTTGETMATIQFNHRGMSEAEIQQEIDDLVQWFAKAKGTPAEVTSLSVQPYDGVSNSAPVDLPVKVVAGPETITEKLLGRVFHVSSNAFFQVNSAAAEVLFSKVTEWAGVNERSIVLDVCCGTGTIGQCVSAKARHVYGLEMAPDAVADARVNAERNGIENITYIVGKAEDTADQLLQSINKNYKDAKDGEIIGIVDPPRAGLHQNVIKSLRTLETMKKLVYVSCNQNSLVVDAARLCKTITNTMKGTPFKPVKAIAVDLFPHTELCEVVVLFERVTNEEQQSNKSNNNNNNTTTNNENTNTTTSTSETTSTTTTTTTTNVTTDNETNKDDSTTNSETSSTTKVE